MIDKTEKYHCPCCGNDTIDSQGENEICDICEWEDDLVQFEESDLSGGANKMCLNQARQAYKNGKKVS